MTKQQRFFRLLNASRAYVEAQADWMRACDQIIRNPFHMDKAEHDDIRRTMAHASRWIDASNQLIKDNVDDDVRLRDYTAFLGALDKLADERSRKG